MSHVDKESVYGFPIPFLFSWQLQQFKHSSLLWLQFIEWIISDSNLIWSEGISTHNVPANPLAILLDSSNSQLPKSGTYRPKKVNIYFWWRGVISRECTVSKDELRLKEMEMGEALRALKTIWHERKGWEARRYISTFSKVARPHRLEPTFEMEAQCAWENESVANIFNFSRNLYTQPASAWERENHM